MTQSASDEEVRLRKRARRRLVGAIILVGIVVVVLPWVVDNEPPPPLENVRIVMPPVPPVEQRFARELPAAPDHSAAAPPGPGVTESLPAAEPSPGRVPAAAVTPPPPSPQAPLRPVPGAVPAASEGASSSATGPKDRAPAATGKGFVVRLGAFASRQNANQLLERVRARGFPAYLEPVKSQGGEVVRVRGGPYPSPEVAQEARSRLLAAKLGSGDLKVVPRGQ